jgi:hypothetical protein
MESRLSQEVFRGEFVVVVTAGQDQCHTKASPCSQMLLSCESSGQDVRSVYGCCDTECYVARKIYREIAEIAGVVGERMLSKERRKALSLTEYGLTTFTRR